MFPTYKTLHKLRYSFLSRILVQSPLIITVTLLLVLTSCSSNNDSTNGDKSIPPESSKITLTGISFENDGYELEVNETKTVNIYELYSDGSKVLLTSNLQWLSMSIDRNYYISLNNTDGIWNITGHSGGGITTLITSYRGFRSSTTIQVIPRIVSVDVTPTGRHVPVAYFEQYQAMANYNDGHIEDVTAQASWSVSDDVIATISNETDTAGLLTTSNFGVTEVIAEVSGITGRTSLTVPTALPFGRSYSIETGEPSPTIVDYGLPVVKINKQGNVGIIQITKTNGYSGFTSEISLSFYDRDKGWENVIVVDGELGYNPGAPLLSFNDSGDMMSVWRSADGIHTAFISGGLDIGAANIVSGSNDPDDTSLAINLIQDNHIGLLWTKDGVLDGNVRYSVFNKTTNSWGEPISVFPYHARPVDVSSNRVGDIILLASSNYDSTTNDFDLVGAFFDSNKKEWGNLANLKRLNAYGSEDGAIALNNHGVAVGLVAIDQGGNANDLVEFIYFSPENGWSTESALSSSVDIRWIKPSINDSGYAAVVWNDNARSYPVVTKQYSPLTGWGPEHTLAEGILGNIEAFTPIYLNNGEIIYTWKKNGGPLGYYHENIATQHFTPEDGWGDVKVLYELGMTGNPSIYWDKNSSDQIVISWQECCEYIPSQLGYFLSHHNYVHLYYEF